jgi:hypothetical protein
VDSPFTVAWVAWLGAFVVIEAVAIFRRRGGDTLSEHVWKWFAVGTPTGPVTWTIRARRISLAAFMLWLTAHFLTGGKV